MSDRVSNRLSVVIQQFGHRLKKPMLLRLWSCLLATALLHVTAPSVSAQETRLLLNDAKVLVREITVSPGQTYALPKKDGVIWVALDPLNLSTIRQGRQVQKRVAPGDAATASPDVQTNFRAEGKVTARLVVVTPRLVQQELTEGPFLIACSDRCGGCGNTMGMENVLCLQPTSGLGLCQSCEKRNTTLLAEFHLSGLSQARFGE